MPLLLYRRGGVRAHEGGWGRGHGSERLGNIAWLAAQVLARLDPKPTNVEKGQCWEMSDVAKRRSTWFSFRSLVALGMICRNTMRVGAGCCNDAQSRAKGLARRA